MNRQQQDVNADAMFAPAELREGGLQVSVAELREGADVRGGNKTSHPDDTPVVSDEFRDRTTAVGDVE